jgi:hypothetical protein
MSFRLPPAIACWQHLGVRSGFEVSYFQALEGTGRIDRTTAAIEDTQAWGCELSHRARCSLGHSQRAHFGQDRVGVM